MGKFIKEVPPTQAEFVLQFTQDEVDMLQGIVADLLDNPHRRVRMNYEVDSSYVAPSAHGAKVLKGVFEALGKVGEGPEYDYFEFWDEVDMLDSNGNKVLD